MFKRLPFPWVYVLELLLAAPLLVSFYLVVAFLASTPADALRAAGTSVPPNWEAAIPNHSGYLRGFLPSEHPVLMAISVAALAAFALIAWQLRVAQGSQLRASPPEQVRRHKVAGLATFSAWAVMAWLLVRHGLRYLAAA